MAEQRDRLAAKGKKTEDTPRVLDPVALERFLDVPMRLGVRLDRRPLRVRSMLALKQGSVIKLTRSAGEKVDLLLDGLAIGAGEIVVIEDIIGLRITDLDYDSRRWGDDK